MTWQDVLIGSEQVLFAVALVPSLLSERKPHAVTSALTGLTLLAFAVAYASLDLVYSAAAALLCGVLWLVLLLQVLLRQLREGSRKTRADGGARPSFAERAGKS
jgi:hypothetical protein